MLSGGKMPTIRSAATIGAKTSIGSIKTLGSKHLKTAKAKDGKEGNTNQEEDTEAAKSNKQAAEKNGTETSIDTKVKKLLKDVQKAREVNGKNPDPNAPINSENDPSRFDNVNKLEGNTKEDAAKNFGFSLPGTSGKQNSQQQAAQAAQQATASGGGAVASGGGAGGSGGGSGSGGSSGGSRPNSGGGNPGTGGGPITGPGTGSGDHQTNPAGIQSREVTSHGGFNDIKYVAKSGNQEYFQQKYPGQHIETIANENGTSQYIVHSPLDPNHSEPGHSPNLDTQSIEPQSLQNQEQLASSDVNAEEEIQQAQEQPQTPEPEIHNHEQLA